MRFRSLDSLVDQVPSDGRAIMKVDVEGTENEVLRYGQGFLAAHTPDIVCEVLHGVADGPVLESLLSPTATGSTGIRGDRSGARGSHRADHRRPRLGLHDEGASRPLH